MLPHVSALVEAGEVVVAAAHEEEVRVGTWTVDDPDLARRLFSWGVDAVATNDPATMVRVRDEIRAEA